MRQYLIGFPNGNLVEINSTKELSKKEAFTEAIEIANGILVGKPVSFTDSTARLIRNKEKNTRKLLKEVKPKKTVTEPVEM